MTRYHIMQRYVHFIKINAPTEKEKNLSIQSNQIVSSEKMASMLIRSAGLAEILAKKTAPKVRKIRKR